MLEHTIHMTDDKNKTLVRVGPEEMVFNCSYLQFLVGYRRCHSGVLMQDAFPFLTADEREFLMSGTTPKKWEEMYGHDKNTVNIKGKEPNG